MECQQLESFVRQDRSAFAEGYGVTGIHKINIP